MAKFVIDTNVPIVANNKDDDIHIDCQVAAIEFLRGALRNGKIFLDNAGDIQEEYRRYLNSNGQPGVGDRFYREVINSHPDRVVRLEVKKRLDGEYDDLPQPIIDAGFDPSDRKFAAVAVKADAKACNAVDEDWLEHRDVIEANGIEIVFVCGCDPARWRSLG